MQDCGEEFERENATEKLEVTEDMAKKQCRKMLNWKAPGSWRAPKSDVDRIYVSWTMGGTDLISCEGFIRIEESNLEWYAKNSVEPFIEGVRAVKTLEYNDIVTKNEFRET